MGWKTREVLYLFSRSRFLVINFIFVYLLA